MDLEKLFSNVITRIESCMLHQIMAFERIDVWQYLHGFSTLSTLGSLPDKAQDGYSHTQVSWSWLYRKLVTRQSAIKPKHGDGCA